MEAKIVSVIRNIFSYKFKAKILILCFRTCSSLSCDTCLVSLWKKNARGDWFAAPQP